jgi:hypothetical protein
MGVRNASAFVIIRPSVLTNVDESAGRSFAKLLALVRQRDVDDAWYVPRRCLHPDRVRSDQL